jgi:phenylacetate-CoA ligase
MAWECRHSGDLHTCDDGVLIEVLVDGRPAEPGERGEVVVTNLHAYAMPFIRYRIGDVATREAPCGCGAPFAAIGEIRSSSGLPLDRIQPAADPGRRMLGA